MKEIIDITPMSDEERFWALFAESYDIQQAADAKALYALNKQRYKEMQEAYKLLKALASESDPEAEVTYETREGLKSTFDVEVICNMLEVTNSQMETFKRIVELADNVGIWPAPHKQISVSFTFNNVMTKRK